MRYAVTRRGTVSLAKTEASFQKASSADLLLKVRGSSDRTGTAATRQLTGDLPAISLALRPWTGLDAGRPKAADLKSRSALRTAHSRAPVRHLTDAPARRSGAGRTVSGELDSALPTHPLRLMMRSSIWTCRAPPGSPARPRCQASGPSRYRQDTRRPRLLLRQVPSESVRAFPARP